MSLPVVDNVSRQTARQNYWAFLVLGLTAIAVLLLRPINPEASITVTSGFLFGYILQRSRFCFAAAFRDVFMVRNTAVSRAVLLLIILTSLGFALVHLIKGDALPAGGTIYPVGFHTIAGGLIFGFGLVIAGNCVTGCLMRMGEGYLMQWVTFIGLMVGLSFGAWHLGWWGPIFIEPSPVVYFPQLLGWPLTLLLYCTVIALLYGLAIWYEHSPSKISDIFKWQKISLFAVIRGAVQTIFSSRNWSYTLGAVSLAVTGTLLLYFWGRAAGVTSGLTHLAGWLSCRVGFLPCDWYYFDKYVYLESRRIYLEHPLLYLTVALVAGSFFASLLHREFIIRRIKSYRFVYSALAGGFMLGYSSRVAMGCNFGGFWSGLASFSLHAWVFGLFILIGAYLGGKFFMRYLL